MNQNLRNYAQQLIQNSPNLPKTPWTQAGVNAILNNDAKAGEQLANNILNAMGMTKEQAMDIARQNHLLPPF